MNLQAELTRIETKAREDKERVEKEYAILELIGPSVAEYETPRIHPYKLYGSRGSINFASPFSSSLAKGKAPDSALLAYLLEQFQPIPLVQVKDGCTSFRPALQEWKGELLDVYPVTVYIETMHNPQAKFEWYANFAGEVWNFEVTIPLYQTDLGTLRVERDYHDRWQNIEYSTIRVCEFTPKHGAQRIKWAAGDRKYTNNFTLYWDVDSGKAVDFPALIRTK